MGRYARNSIGQYAPVGAAADDLPGGATPTGKKTIDTTAEVDVASYATAQVVDENLTAANIKKDVPVLGITGEYEGGSSGEFSPVEITLILNGDGASDTFVTLLYDYDETEQAFIYCSGFFIDNETGVIAESTEVAITNPVGTQTGQETETLYIQTGHTVYVMALTYGDAYTVTGSAEVVNIIDNGDTYKAAKVSGDCTIAVTAV